MIDLIGQSNHVYVRPWRSSDAQSWWNLSQNEGLNKFSISGYKQESPSTAKNFIENWKSIFEEKKIGVFPVFHKRTHEMLGVCGLKSATFDHENSSYIEVMYRLADFCWGHGYATEVASILLIYAFKLLKLPEVIGFIEADNVASERVLQKAGMTFQRRAFYCEKEVKVYSLGKSDFFKMPGFVVERSGEKELDLVNLFYKSVGYTYQADSRDLVFSLKQDGKIIGAVRLVEEFGELILRGMHIGPKYQGRGVGVQLLRQLERYLQSANRDCYCIPYRHLERFYGQIGFQKVEDGPNFLIERLAKYQLNKTDVILMRRVAEKLPCEF